MADDILCDIKKHIAVVTLNRPLALNAFTEEMLEKGREIFESLAGDEAVRCIVLTGAGKHFSAGGDMGRFKEAIENKVFLTHEFIGRAAAMAKAILTCPKPVIGMINGAAVGGGCGLALACDLRVVTERTSFVMAFINVGLGGDTGSLYNLVRLVGLGRAKEMIMLGEPVGGREAVAIGLANRLAGEDQLEETAHALAAKLAALPAGAFRQQKAIIFASFHESFPAYTKMEIDSVVESSKSADFAEAVNAFLEKRPPRFAGT